MKSKRYYTIGQTRRPGDTMIGARVGENIRGTMKTKGESGREGRTRGGKMRGGGAFS